MDNVSLDLPSFVKDECCKSALQIAIEKIKVLAQLGTDTGSQFNNTGTVYESDAIEILEELEVALTDCYKLNK